MLGNDDIKIKIGATDTTGAAFRSAETKMKAFSGMAKTAMGALGVGISVGAITSAVQGAIDFGSSINDAAIATQTSTDALQALRFAATQAGASSGQLDKALIKLNNSAVAASDGTGAEADALKALGINAKAFAAMNADQRMTALATAVAGAKDQNVALSAAMDLMGSKNAPALMAVLQQLGKDGFDALKKSAEDAGQLMDQATIDRLDSAGDALDRLKTSATITVGESVAFWYDLFDGLENDTQAVTNLREAFEKLWNVLKWTPGGIIMQAEGALLKKAFGGEEAPAEEKTQQKATLQKSKQSGFLDYLQRTGQIKDFQIQADGTWKKTAPATGQSSGVEAEILRTAELNAQLAEKLRASNNRTTTALSQIKTERR